MERTPVKSSDLVSVGYDEKSETLQIEFKNGIYQYSNVPKEIYSELIQAPSKGKYANKSIRDKYPTNKIS